MTTNLRFPANVVALWLIATAAAAHPVPKDTHDRTIVVRLQKGDKDGRIRVRVEYRLEVDETTVYLSDMHEFRDEVNPLDFRNRPLDYYGEFAKIYAPIYADRLVVRVNKAEIGEFRCLSRKARLEDDDGMKLGHVRCDFVFESSFDLEPGRETKFRLRERNYLFDAGKIDLSLVNESGARIVSQAVPDDALRKRLAEKGDPDDENLAREITVVFAPLHPQSKDAPKPAEPHEEASSAKLPAPPQSKTNDHDVWFSLEKLILPAEYGVALTLLLAFVFGAGHALTPGHGKTLVAAYLVGERGTIWHALYLGLVTTLTHTGVVIAVAAVLIFLPAEMQQNFKRWIQNGLGLVMGLIVACMGFWLLLQRLSGRADHIHLDGGHHHHHDAPAAMNWRGLTILGITGGMIPCWDAVAVLFLAVGRSEFWFVLPAVLAFSTGLAIVLVAIGVVMVQVPRFVEARAGNGRLLRALPIVSAILVTGMGLWLCYQGTRGM
jgi:nickel/cobalt transporter (NicO) family protein